jgi:hypothetical protein
MSRALIAQEENIRQFYLALNRLLGLNDVTYSLPLTYCYSTVLTIYVEHLKAIELVAILGMIA